MNKIRWGIIGCGDVTELKSGPAFNKVKNSELVAVMRRNAEKAKDYAQLEETWPMMRQHVYLIADTLTTALVKQFPSKFL